MRRIVVRACCAVLFLHKYILHDLSRTALRGPGARVGLGDTTTRNRARAVLHCSPVAPLSRLSTGVRAVRTESLMNELKCISRRSHNTRTVRVLTELTIP